MAQDSELPEMIELHLDEEWEAQIRMQAALSMFARQAIAAGRAALEEAGRGE